MSPSRFFSSGHVTVLAHRGLADRAPENTLAAFQAALDAGADVLECDVRASKDGVAVIVHDETLARVFRDDRRVDQLTYPQLRTLTSSPRTSVVSVADALAAFPTALFNIDVKSDDAIAPLAAAVIENSAIARVLITSFSDRRREKTLGLLRGAITSLSARGVALVVLSCHLGLVSLARYFGDGVRVLQIPTKVLGVDTGSQRMIRRFHRAGFTVHFWTINSPQEMRRLVAAGADGIVTDHCDVARAELT